MDLLASLTVVHSGSERRIELLSGDLTKLPLEHRVDVVVVSAFRNDYSPTRTSLVGAFDRVGLSMDRLSKNKLIDLRAQYSCWMSHDVDPQFNFRRILCIESGWRASPPEIAGDIFRSIAPYLLTEFHDNSIAMPLVFSGDHRFPPTQMLECIVRSGIEWMGRGLPLKTLKIVIYNRLDLMNLVQSFNSIRLDHEENNGDQVKGAVNAPHEYDLFLSYSHKDHEMAQCVLTTLREQRKELRIFCDTVSLRAGDTWLLNIARALDSSGRVIALYSPDYWASSNCKDEYAAALLRQNDTGRPILYPIYLSDASIPYLFRNVQYIDCRVKDRKKLEEACRALVQTL